jgi:hypothetical protein
VFLALSIGNRLSPQTDAFWDFVLQLLLTSGKPEVAPDEQGSLA